MNLNGPAWRHYNPILSNYGGPVYRVPRGARLARPGCAIKSDVNGRNPCPTIPIVLLEPIRDALRGGMLPSRLGSKNDDKAGYGVTLSIGAP